MFLSVLKKARQTSLIGEGMLPSRWFQGRGWPETFASGPPGWSSRAVMQGGSQDGELPPGVETLAGSPAWPHYGPWATASSPLLLQHLAVAGPACMKPEILRFGEPSQLFPSRTLAH